MITLHFQQTYLNDIWRRVRKLNHGHVVRRPALSPLHRHCFLYIKDYLEICTNRTFVTSLMNHLMIWIEWQFNKDFNTSAESFYCFVFLSKILNPSMYKLTYTPPPPPHPTVIQGEGVMDPLGLRSVLSQPNKFTLETPELPPQDDTNFCRYNGIIWRQMRSFHPPSFYKLI